MFVNKFMLCRCLKDMINVSKFCRCQFEFLKINIFQRDNKILVLVMFFKYLCDMDLFINMVDVFENQIDEQNCIVFLMFWKLKLLDL